MNSLRNLKSMVLLGLLLWSLQLTAQQNKLRWHASSLGIGYASTAEPKIEGPALSLDISTIYVDKHIYSLNFNVGSESRIFGANEEFYELNLTYGRKVALAPKLFLEGHLGIGLFAYEDNVDSPVFNFPDATIGFPVRAKLLYSLSEHFSLGINPNANFNSITNAYSGHFVLQYTFN